MRGESRQARVLVVDDNRLHRESARDALLTLARVECCDSAEAALQALHREPADLVLSDLSMPGLSGLELLERVKREHAGTDFVLVTAYASIDSAVEALRMGAADYLHKPVMAEELHLTVERTLARRRMLEENTRLRDTVATVEACRSLTSCLEANDIYSVTADLLLEAAASGQGLLVYQRADVPASGGVELRGCDDAQGALLRERLVEEKPVELEAFQGVELVSSGPVHEALRAAGLPAPRFLVVPLRGEESETGVFFAPISATVLDETTRARLRLIADHAEIALRNAERYHRAKERAFIDDVTEVYNARYLLEAMERELRRADRYGTELSVLFLDLDRFKLVNDRHGHLVGSQVLRRLSQLLGECVRQVDTLARYGGDEFTILLVDTDERACLRIAERIRKTVEETPFETGRGQTLHLTCSVGIATHPEHGRSREALLEAADKAMYRAKSNGRNRVCSASELD